MWIRRLFIIIVISFSSSFKKQLFALAHILGNSGFISAADNIHHRGEAFEEIYVRMLKDEDASIATDWDAFSTTECSAEFTTSIKICRKSFHKTVW